MRITPHDSYSFVDAPDQLLGDIDMTRKTAGHLAHRLRTAYARGGAALNGRGTVGKSVVIGLKNRGTNEVRAKVVPSTDAPTLQGFVRDDTEPGATVYTDEATAYRGLARDDDHESVNHFADDYIRVMARKRQSYADLSAYNGLHSGAQS